MNSAVHSPRVGRLLDSAVLAGERSAPAILAVVIALYVAATCGRASQKLLWRLARSVGVSPIAMNEPVPGGSPVSVAPKVLR